MDQLQLGKEILKMNSCDPLNPEEFMLIHQSPSFETR
jgi:hypothetical protein